MVKRILFTGGGSAGHVVPNIALMQDVLADGKAELFYIGSNGIEKSIVEKLKIPYLEIDCPKLIRGGGLQGLKRNLSIPSRFIKAVKQAEKALRLTKPQAVFSKGGYVALPVVFAAKKLKIPCFAHESDFSIGLANKLSAGKCEKVFTSFPETAKRIKHGEYSGAPIRKDLFSYSKKEARSKLNIPLRAKVLLVFGGGSGSECINRAIRAQLDYLCEKYFILHICGKGNLLSLEHKNYLQFEFVSDMAMLYAACDGVVSRSGAGAVFEILALKKPALFIPLAAQTRGDQAENAEYFSKRKLCHELSQHSIGNLSSAIEKLFLDATLKENLKTCQFQSGNEKIIKALYQACEQVKSRE